MPGFPPPCFSFKLDPHTRCTHVHTRTHSTCWLNASQWLELDWAEAKSSSGSPIRVAGTLEHEPSLLPPLCLPEQGAGSWGAARARTHAP